MNKYDVVALGELLVDFTEEGLSTQGINTDNLAEDPEVPTTLAFVHTKADGDRSLEGYAKETRNLSIIERGIKMRELEVALKSIAPYKSSL